jgi:glutamyl-tRNA synthetase
MNLRGLVLQYALQNAVFYKGKADMAAVLGKILADSPDLRQDIANVRKVIEETISEVNGMDPEQQKKRLRELSPKMLVKEKKREELPPIPGAVKGRFVTRFAPSPSGPLNLGQMLRAVMLPYLYAKKYEGIFILRIEDTDPRNIEKAFYGFIMEDLLSTGIKWYKMVKESDNLENYYKHAEALIRTGKAYACFCSAEDFRKYKRKKLDCPCRSKPYLDNLTVWHRMLRGRYKEGEVVIRLKTSMKNPNPTLRDPPLLRITEAAHPLRGNQFRVWPLYNFACTIEDKYLGITHVFRGKEHEHNTAIQNKIYSAFGWKGPAVVNFGMIYLPGTKVHTRDMKQWVAEKKVDGWDDPRLPTVRALLRRGFQPEALRAFAKVAGMSKTDIRIGWENLEGINRKLIDPLSNRFMVVTDPVRISVRGAPDIKKVYENVHPDFPARGKRSMPVNMKSIYISGDDWKKYRNRLVRLKGLGNIRLGKVSEYRGGEIVEKMPKIQWVSEPGVIVEIMSPKGLIIGAGEINMKELKPGTLIQMERVGFGRIDHVGQKKIVVYFAHK